MHGRLPAAALALAGVLLLGGCAPPAVQPTAWQGSVETVADQAAGGDYAGALASLDALEAEVVARRDAGEVPVNEADRILAAIATVRADLAALVPAPEPTPEPEPAQTTQEPTPETPVSTPDDGDDEAPEEQSPSDDGDEDDRPGNEGKPPKEDKPPKEKKQKNGGDSMPPASSNGRGAGASEQGKG